MKISPVGCALCGETLTCLKVCPECHRRYCNACGHMRVSCAQCGAYLRTRVFVGYGSAKPRWVLLPTPSKTSR